MTITAVDTPSLTAEAAAVLAATPGMRYAEFLTAAPAVPGIVAVVAEESARAALGLTPAAGDVLAVDVADESLQCREVRAAFQSGRTGVSPLRQAFAALLAGGHVLGTLVSESVLEAQVRAGVLPVTARLAVDVGPSYFVAPALVLGLLLGRPLVARAASGLGFALLAPHLFGGLGHLEVSSVGHVVAIGLALVAGPVLAADRRRGSGPALVVDAP